MIKSIFMIFVWVLVLFLSYKFIKLNITHKEKHGIDNEENL